MEKEIKIESLKINIGKKEIELSVEEAKKLKKALEDIFGKEIVHEHHHDWWYRPYYPVQPYYWGTIACGGTSNLTSSISASITNANQLCMTITG